MRNNGIHSKEGGVSTDSSEVCLEHGAHVRVSRRFSPSDSRTENGNMRRAEDAK